MFEPRLVLLDTASWGRIARAHRGDDNARRVLSCLDSGALIPFFTSGLLEELVRHGDDKVFRERIELLRGLPFIAFPRIRNSSVRIGDALEAREHEMAVLVESPDASHDQIVARARCRVVNGFCSGVELCAGNLEWWEYYRANFADYMLASSAETASISHFPEPLLAPTTKLSDLVENPQLRSKAEVKRLLAERFRSLSKQLRENGDKRLRDPGKRLKSPEDLALWFLAEVHDHILPLYDMEGDFLENLLRTAGIDRSRLSSNATVDDIGYESIFVGSLRIHERRLSLPEGTLKQIARQEVVPSWVVWRELNRALKRLKNVEGSSLNDAKIAPFALYVDALETDKRVYDCVRQAAQVNPLLRLVSTRVFRTRNLKELAERVEALSSPSAAA